MRLHVCALLTFPCLLSVAISCSSDRRDRRVAVRSTDSVVQPRAPNVDTRPVEAADSGSAVLGGKSCPTGTKDSVRVTADLVLCGKRAQRGADLVTIAIDSVPDGTGRYVEATRSYVPAADTTVWLVVTRRVGGDVVRLVRGPIAMSAVAVASLTAGSHAADSIGVGSCRLDHGATRRDIIAVTRHTPGAEWQSAVRAWRAVPRPPHFEELPAARVECLVEEGDSDDDAPPHARAP